MHSVKGIFLAVLQNGKIDNWFISTFSLNMKRAHKFVQWQRNAWDKPSIAAFSSIDKCVMWNWLQAIAQSVQCVFQPQIQLLFGHLFLNRNASTTENNGKLVENENKPTTTPTTTTTKISCFHYKTLVYCKIIMLWRLRWRMLRLFCKSYCTREESDWWHTHTQRERKKKKSPSKRKKWQFVCALCFECVIFIVCDLHNIATVEWNAKAIRLSHDDKSVQLSLQMCLERSLACLHSNRSYFRSVSTENFISFYCEYIYIFRMWCKHWNWHRIYSAIAAARLMSGPKLKREREREQSASEKQIKKIS